MSYLAMSAAPIDIESNSNSNGGNNHVTNNNSSINKKRVKTQKNRMTEDFDHQKVKSVLQSIHNGDYDDDDDDIHDTYARVHKPINPILKEGMSNGTLNHTNNNNNQVPQPIEDDKLSLQGLQSAHMNDAQVREYYRKLIPTSYDAKARQMQQQQGQMQGFQTQMQSQDQNQVFIEKLNYMIHLLEEQQDQKTGNVMEEVILYSFLGVFIIFIVDSFTKVGKYYR